MKKRRRMLRKREFMRILLCLYYKILSGVLLGQRGLVVASFMRIILSGFVVLSARYLSTNSSRRQL